jgi:mersacidin/lichenicidin family type 2 lantibiotic
MKKEMIVRAWRDPEYRSSLSTEQRATLPDHPSGKSLPELDEADLGLALGGWIDPETRWSGCTKKLEC